MHLRYFSIFLIPNIATVHSGLKYRKNHTILGSRTIFSTPCMKYQFFSFDDGKMTFKINNFFMSLTINKLYINCNTIYLARFIWNAKVSDTYFSAVIPT